MNDPYLYYKSIKDTPVCGHHRVLKFGIWMSDPICTTTQLKTPLLFVVTWTLIVLS